MTETQDIIDYYADLLIMQYESKPKAYAHIQAIIKNIVMDQLPTQVMNGFDIDDAVGVQLDIIGKYVGVKRSVYSFTRPVTLTDSDFRTMIKIAAIKNSAGSSLYDIQILLNTFFPDSLFVFDFRTMRIGYFFDANIGSRELVEVFVKSGFLPKPMGVSMSALIYSSNIDSLFGFRTYAIDSQNVSGFNSYVDYSEDDSWLSYANAISL